MDYAEKNIRLLNAIKCLQSLFFIIPVMTAYYRDQLGLGFGDFMVAETVFTAVVVLGEVPSGWLSDIWTRKKVMILATLAGLAGNAVMLCAQSLSHMIAAEALLGLAVSLLSGTDSALLYDSLLNAGRADTYVRAQGKYSGLGFYSVALASLLSGFIYSLHPQLPLALTVLSYAIALVLCLYLHEPPRQKKKADTHPLADMVETMRYAFRGHREVLMIVLFAALFFSTTKALMWAQQPYFMALALEEWMFGILMGTGFILAGLSMHHAYRLALCLSLRRILTLCWFVAVMATVLSGLQTGWHGVALLMVSGSCLYGISAPHVENAIQRVTSSERRATVLSTGSLMRQLAFMPLSLSLGMVSDYYGIGLALLGISLWLCFAGLFLLAWIRR